MRLRPAQPGQFDEDGESEWVGSVPLQPRHVHSEDRDLCRHSPTPQTEPPAALYMVPVHQACPLSTHQGLEIPEGPVARQESFLAWLHRRLEGLEGRHCRRRSRDRPRLLRPRSARRSGVTRRRARHRPPRLRWAIGRIVIPKRQDTSSDRSAASGRIVMRPVSPFRQTGYPNRTLHQPARLTEWLSQSPS
jgi:hypothetical protein